MYYSSYPGLRNYPGIKFKILFLFVPVSAAIRFSLLYCMYACSVVLASLRTRPPLQVELRIAITYIVEDDGYGLAPLSQGYGIFVCFVWSWWNVHDECLGLKPSSILQDS